MNYHYLNIIILNQNIHIIHHVNPNSINHSIIKHHVCQYKQNVKQQIHIIVDGNKVDFQNNYLINKINILIL